VWTNGVCYEVRYSESLTQSVNGALKHQTALAAKQLAAEMHEMQRVTRHR
jgi:hypothetical protein